jgi:23S rRNA pseudouridine2605 synthase
MAKERVQKILAKAGIASRRKAEELISDGMVTINGRVAQLGDQAEYGKDAIKVGGNLLHTKEALAYLVFHKPKGLISMMGDPQGRPSLSDYLTQVKYRLFPVGRLDFNSEGIIVLTNDGDFAEKVQKHAEIIRVYHVKIGKHPSPEDIERLGRGGKIGDKMFKPHSVTLAQEFTKKSMIEVTIMGGGAVDLKTYFESKGFQIERIIRVAFGHLRLGTLEPGRYRFLKGPQAYALLEQPELGMKRQEFEAEKAERKKPPLTAKKIEPLKKSGAPRKSRAPKKSDFPRSTSGRKASGSKRIEPNSPRRKRT